jgi:hypothetical protein
MAVKKTSAIKPKNPNDPKNPFANIEQEIFSGSGNEVEERSEPTSSKYLASKKEINSFVFDRNETTQTLEQEALKSKALSILRKSKPDDRKIIDENNPESMKFLEEEVRTFGEYVTPDPNSAHKFRQTQGSEYQLTYAKKHQEAVKLKIRGLQDVIRTPLQAKDVRKLLNEFQHYIIKIAKTEIVLKSAKYGFEIYYNNADNRWWIVTLKFDEPYDPKKLNYITYWVGNTFIGYGFKTITQLIEKTREMLTRGRTGYVAWRDHMVSFNEKTNRIHTNTEPVALTFKEYKKFVAWFKKNKIWVMVKRDGMKDSEDLMLEVREQRKRGEKVSPLAGVQAKLVEPPRKPNFITSYPVPDPKYTGDEYDNPENKLYQVGFAFNE